MFSKLPEYILTAGLLHLLGPVLGMLSLKHLHGSMPPLGLVRPHFLSEFALTTLHSISLPFSVSSWQQHLLKC